MKDGLVDALLVNLLDDTVNTIADILKRKETRQQHY